MLLIILYSDTLNLVDPHILQAKEVTIDTDKYGLVHYFCIGFPEDGFKILSVRPRLGSGEKKMRRKSGLSS